jgi:ABC-2 type transport system permease protein
MNSLAGARALVRLVLRRDRWLLPLWILALGGYPLLNVLVTADLNPTDAERAAYAATVNVNAGFLLLEGPAYGSSLGALATWRAGDVLWMVALASLLTVIRHTRAEEEAGRRELLGATVVGRHAGLAAALGVVLAANLALALVAAAGARGLGLPAGGSIALGLKIAAAGWVFAALAGVAAQLTANAAGGRSIALALTGAAFLLRAVGDAGGADGGASRLAWLSPFGWAHQIRPYAGERWWPLALAAGVTALLTAVAVALEARRDVGAGVLRPRLGPAAASPALRSPLALAWRLHRGALFGWAAGFAAIGGVLGGSAGGAGDLFGDSPQLRDLFERLGGAAAASDTFLAGIMSLLGLVAGAYAIQAALRPRAEEVGLRAEPVLATAVGRLSWAASHLACALLGPAGWSMAWPSATWPASCRVCWRVRSCSCPPSGCWPGAPRRSSACCHGS